MTAEWWGGGQVGSFLGDSLFAIRASPLFTTHLSPFTAHAFGVMDLLRIRLV